MRIGGQLLYSESTGWTVAELSINMRLDEMNVLFRGLESGEDFFNEIMSAVGPELFDEVWLMMEPLVVVQVTEMMLESLNEMTVSELLALMNGDPAELFPPVVPLS